MSNKKRISKKINKIESKKIQNFVYGIDFAGIQADNAAVIINKLAEAMEKSVLKLRVFMDNIIGFDFQTCNNPNHRMFIDDVRKLTHLNYVQAYNLCREIPEKLYEDYKNLLIVGFPADEAIELLRETYKF